MKTERLAILLTSGQKRTLAALADELRRSVKKSRAALRAALTQTEATLAQLAKRRKERLSA
ncbi:MAG: hypothetical protein AABM33_01725 [Pseudomonadota bacterium]